MSPLPGDGPYCIRAWLCTPKTAVTAVSIELAYVTVSIWLAYVMVSIWLAYVTVSIYLACVTVSICQRPQLAFRQHVSKLAQAKDHS